MSLMIVDKKWNNLLEELECESLASLHVITVKILRIGREIYLILCDSDLDDHRNFGNIMNG